MIQITPHMRILAAVEPVDFRKGIDGLCRLCRTELRSDPFSGAIFVFRNRRRTALRLRWPGVLVVSQAAVHGALPLAWKNNVPEDGIPGRL
jgi:transposase